tara:strand:+ start:115 stop:348 length:234 start_codon:yes stop_codon:yes gene_type:complete
MKWKDFTKGILTDALPKDRTKYVKFSNLASINKKMVKYYLDIGKASPERRVQAVRGILEEMLRSSNERYDIEDSGQP